MCISISISVCYILVGRPFLSGVWAIVGFVEVLLGSAHGVVACRLLLVVGEGRSAACVAGVVAVNVAAVGPTIVGIVVPLGR